MSVSTASPRVYWFRRPLTGPHVVELITHDTRCPLPRCPVAFRIDDDGYNWDAHNSGSRALSMALLWDAFGKVEVVQKFWRQLLDDVILCSPVPDNFCITNSHLSEWFVTTNLQRLGALGEPECGGCPQ